MKTLDNLFKKSKCIKIDDDSKLVIMSDCHRGFGESADNFRKNKNIYNAALEHYYKNEFTYIELGDGDEMWEVKDYEKIIEEHLESFKRLKKFYGSNRMYMIYGNHDIIKREEKVMKKYFSSYENKETNQSFELFPDLSVLESLVLQYKDNYIFLIHGHQIDFLNSKLWRLARFFVRYLWRKMENFGFSSSLTVAKNYSVKKRIEKKLHKWSKKNNILLIAGHTHRPIFPKTDEGLYFNDGSCIHPNGITCIEIENGNISLVKWVFDIDDEGQVIIKRYLIDGNESIISFFNKNY